MRKLILSFVLIIVWGCTSHQSQYFENFVLSQNEKNLILQQKCHDRDYPACFRLGKSEMGLGDFVSAKKHFKSSCENKIQNSCSYYAMLAVVDGEISYALGILEKKCKEGVGDACNSRAKYLLAIEADKKAAISWFSKGCKANDLASCYSLLIFSIDKFGKDKTLSQKNWKQLFKRSCDQKKVDYACGYYASVLRTYGENIQSRSVAKKSCDDGDGFACQISGVNNVIASNPSGVLDNLEKSCRFNYPAGCWQLAKKYIELGNTKLGIRHAEKACFLGDSQACSFLGNIYLMKPKVVKDYYRKSCYFLDMGACRAYGIREGGDIRPQRLKVACTLRDDYSCYLHGMDLMEHGLEQDGVKYLEKGCDLARAESCSAIGSYYFKKNQYEKSLKFYNKGCDLKDAISCKNICIINANRKNLVGAKKAYEKYCKSSGDQVKSFEKTCQKEKSIKESVLNVMQKGSFSMGIGVPSYRYGNIEELAHKQGVQINFDFSAFPGGNKYGFSFGLFGSNFGQNKDELYTSSLHNSDDTLSELGFYGGFAYQQFFWKRWSLYYSVSPSLGLVQYGGDSEDTLEGINLSFIQQAKLNFLIYKFWNNTKYVGVFAGLGIYDQYSFYGEINSVKTSGHSLGGMFYLGVGF